MWLGNFNLLHNKQQHKRACKATRSNAIMMMISELLTTQSCTLRKQPYTHIYRHHLTDWLRQFQMNLLQLARYPFDYLLQLLEIHANSRDRRKTFHLLDTIRLSLPGRSHDLLHLLASMYNSPQSATSLQSSPRVHNIPHHPSTALSFSTIIIKYCCVWYHHRESWQKEHRVEWPGGLGAHVGGFRVEKFFWIFK